MMYFSLRSLAVALACVTLSGCAAMASVSKPDSSTLTAECRSVADSESHQHGIDELAALPGICNRLADAVRLHARNPVSDGPAQHFDAAYDECLSAGKHRGALFTYRGHPGAPQTYRRVRAICDAFKGAFAQAGH